MAIKNVVQRGTNVYAYDGEGNKLFNKPGALVSFTDDSVLVRRGDRVCKLDQYGYVVDSNYKEPMTFREFLVSVGAVFLFVVVIGTIGVLIDVNSKKEKPVESQKSTSVKPTYWEFWEPQARQQHQESTSWTRDYTKPREISQKALSLYETKHYGEAKERFIWLAKIKHKPAFSSYRQGNVLINKSITQKPLSFTSKAWQLKTKPNTRPLCFGTWRKPTRL
ncbi:hypothetical protein NHP20013_08320 [Helicobacter bizzozeronii]|nr:hypothetical protein NHP20013_08320 [Helicobacter bizzozeronii]